MVGEFVVVDRSRKLLGEKPGGQEGICSLWFGAKGPGKGMQAWQSREHSRNRKIRVGALLEVHGRTFS